MCDFQSIQDLIAEACSYPPGHPQRQRRLTKIVQLVSKRLWTSNTPYYQDALQQTWIYFCQNLCEAKTGRAFDPTQANVVTWLNAYLKRRLQDGFIDQQKQRRLFVKPLSAHFKDEDAVVDPVDRLPARPDVPPLLEEVETWAEKALDPRLKSIRLSQHPQVTCQLLILKRLPPEVPWKELSAELQIPVGTLSSFYQRHCLPLLREFGHSQGYL